MNLKTAGWETSGGFRFITHLIVAYPTTEPKPLVSSGDEPKARIILS